MKSILQRSIESKVGFLIVFLFVSWMATLVYNSVLDLLTLQDVLSVSERNHNLKKKAGLPNKAGTLKSILGNETESPPSLNSGSLWESTYKKPIGRKSPPE